MKRIVFGISGASGTIYSKYMLKQLSLIEDLEIHLVISQGARKVISNENDFGVNELISLAHKNYDPENFAVSIASGSFRHDGMIVCPCSMNTLGCISSGITNNLLQRACDVSLKEGKTLILVVRESPYNRIHLQNMLNITDAGGVIMPFMPAYYLKQEDFIAQISQFTGRILWRMNIPNQLSKEWSNSLDKE